MESILFAQEGVFMYMNVFNNKTVEFFSSGFSVLTYHSFKETRASDH